MLINFNKSLAHDLNLEHNILGLLYAFASTFYQFISQNSL